jgi:uncharacterized protein YkwD
MPSATTSLALAAAAVLASAAAAVPTGLSRGCVLDSSGHEVCTRLDSTLSLGVGIASLARQSTGGSTVTYCNAAVDITNEIRARHGKSGKVVAGTESMLNNAVKHSQEMATSLGLEHQTLSTATAEVGCNVFINRENIAYFGGTEADPAVHCMDQWEKSAGHLENILGAEDGDYVAVGVYKNGNEWWCTQTFGQPGGGNCPMIGQSSGGGTTTTASPATTEKSQPMSFLPNGGSGDGTISPTTTASDAWSTAQTMGAGGAPVTTWAVPVTFADNTMDVPKTTFVPNGDSSEGNLPNAKPTNMPVPTPAGDPYAEFWLWWEKKLHGEQGSSGGKDVSSETNGVNNHMDGITGDGQKVGGEESPIAKTKKPTTTQYVDELPETATRKTGYGGYDDSYDTYGR